MMFTKSQKLVEVEEIKCQRVRFCFSVIYDMLTVFPFQFLGMLAWPRLTQKRKDRVLKRKI